ncbi:hypothetical protein vseg_008173 [Gypsophila vaccaria]
MEGLIPMLYKAIKKHNVRRKYRCLSTGHTQTQSYEFYVGDDQKLYEDDHSTEVRGGYDRDRKKYKRRFGSTRDFKMNRNEDDHDYNKDYFNYEYDEYKGDIGKYSNSTPKDLIKRSKSHRMFSCIIGDP